ncbi:hypothetical protein EE612_031339 [Oryza sativa]|nr:hypothetical protein EE612_031339 [Oryza sativa]
MGDNGGAKRSCRTDARVWRGRSGIRHRAQAR